MRKSDFLHLTWLLPAYFLVMIGYQWQVLKGIDQTYESGENILATITDFDIKQIAAQTNGYVDLAFTPASGQPVQERLTLTVQMAASLVESEVLAIRYLANSFEPIVMTAAYTLHRKVVLSNIAMMAMGLAVTLGVAIAASLSALRSRRSPRETLVFEPIGG